MLGFLDLIASNAPKRPSLLMNVADDLGFSDCRCFMSEVTALDNGTYLSMAESFTAEVLSGKQLEGKLDSKAGKY